MNPLTDSRPNIMFRKIKNYSGRNSTTDEIEFAREQCKLKALQNRRENLSEHRRVTFYGNPDEQASLKSKVDQDAQFQIYLKSQLKSDEQKIEIEEDQKVEAHRKMLVELDKKRDLERKQRLIEIQEDNRIAALIKKSQMIESKIAEDMKDREVIMNSMYRKCPNVF